jgi:hypothetical protein
MADHVVNGVIASAEAQLVDVLPLGRGSRCRRESNAKIEAVLKTARQNMIPKLSSNVPARRYRAVAANAVGAC